MQCLSIYDGILSGPAALLSSNLKRRALIPLVERDIHAGEVVMS